MDTWANVAAERTELANLLETLTPAQWDAQSLCDQWKVRDVVAHVAMGSEKISMGRMMGDMLKYRFSLNRMLAGTAIDAGRQPPEDLVKKLRENAEARNTPPMTKPEDVLADVVVHAQDIRRPLGASRQIPDDRLIGVLDRMKTVGSIIGAKKRIAGLKLAATDVDWTYGDGPEVRGPGEALLMAMSGRRVAIDDLQGEGVETLRSRS